MIWVSMVCKSTTPTKWPLLCCRGIEGMFQDMEISKALAEVFESKPEAKEILEDSAAES